jgi:hypothetical protein
MLIAYARERLPLRLLLPVAVGLAVMAAGLHPTFARLATGVPLALALVVLFRIWDDLQDRPHDAVAHPTRVIVRAPSVRSLQVLAMATALAVGAALALRHLVSAGLFVLLMLALGALYRMRRGRSAAHDALLLAKYPAIVAIVATTGPDANAAFLAVSLPTVYLAAIAYEAWHDKSSPLRTRLGVQS